MLRRRKYLPFTCCLILSYFLPSSLSPSACITGSLLHCNITLRSHKVTLLLINTGRGRYIEFSLCAQAFHLNIKSIYSDRNFASSVRWALLRILYHSFLFPLHSIVSQTPFSRAGHCDRSSFIHGMFRLFTCKLYTSQLFDCLTPSRKTIPLSRQMKFFETFKRRDALLINLKECIKKLRVIF